MRDKHAQGVSTFDEGIHVMRSSLFRTMGTLLRKDRTVSEALSSALSPMQVNSICIHAQTETDTG